MVDHELDELKREFLAEAAEKVREIQHALEGQRTQEALDRLMYLAHQLKGSGGSYGYARISTDAAELEKAFEKMAAESTTAVLEARVQQHVINLEAEVAKHVRELKVAAVS